MNSFNPVAYSVEENNFLISTLGQPPIVALRTLPPSINSNAVKPVLEAVYELMELEKHSGVEWVGVEAVKNAARTFLIQSEKWDRDSKRGAPRWPSLYSVDSRGRFHRSGPGSDSGLPRTYFDSNGNRIPFEIELIPLGVVGNYIPEWIRDDTTVEGLVVNSEANRIECFCGHTERFKAESRASFNAARARISKHLRKATDEVDRHREIHVNEFGGSDH